MFCEGTSFNTGKAWGKNHGEPSEKRLVNLAHLNEVDQRGHQLARIAIWFPPFLFGLLWFPFQDRVCTFIVDQNQRCDSWLGHTFPERSLQTHFPHGSFALNRKPNPLEVEQGLRSEAYTKDQPGCGYLIWFPLEHPTVVVAEFTLLWRTPASRFTKQTCFLFPTRCEVFLFGFSQANQILSSGQSSSGHACPDCFEYLLIDSKNLVDRRNFQFGAMLECRPLLQSGPEVQNARVGMKHLHKQQSGFLSSVFLPPA